MVNIFGTIITVGDFLKKDSKELIIISGDGSEQKFLLSQNRKYLIPDYQREIRWSKENLIELISDISRGDKFLGNIILNKCSATNYEIIDGQQRVTALLMIIYFIKSKFNRELDIIDTCELEMVNFDKFDLFIKNDFNVDKLTLDEKKELEKSDVFNQRERYIELWNVFESIEELQSPTKCNGFLTNLRRSQINLLANTIDTDNYSIEYFIDVNLKGVKLDTEDIFKGYLFSQDSGSEIRTEWKNFKILSFKLKEMKVDYSTTKLLEHYFYCTLYKNEEYKNIQFREDFTISEEIELKRVRHYTGEHLIKVIQDKSYMLNSLKNLNKFIEIIIDIIKVDTPSQEFRGLFNTSADVDNDEKTIIHNFIGKIMRDANVVPKVFIMKYIIEVLFDPTNKNKEDYRNIYGVYLLAVLFTVFESDKNVKRVLPVIKDKNWHIKAIVEAKSYFSRSKISKSKITAQYKIVEPEEMENYMFRCKSLASIFNFFKISNDKVEIIHGKMKDLKEYLSNSERFSTEHFIINESGSININGNVKAYPSEIKKYANSLFNFIFISRDFNNELGNLSIGAKINIIDKKIKNQPTIIECNYSKMIIDMCRTHFEALIDLPEDNMEQTLNNFYQNEFIEKFANYALDVIKKIGEELGVS